MQIDFSSKQALKKNLGLSRHKSWRELGQTGEQSALIRYLWGQDDIESNVSR